MLAVVYSFSAGSIGTLSFDAKQAAEIWITAAQSFFAIALFVKRRGSANELVRRTVWAARSAFGGGPD